MREAGCDSGPVAPMTAPATGSPLPTAAAVTDGPLWGLVRLTVPLPVPSRAVPPPVSRAVVARNLDAAQARRLAAQLMTAADEAEAQRARVREASA